jgi:hypothetical protein
MKRASAGSSKADNFLGRWLGESPGPSIAGLIFTMKFLRWTRRVTLRHSSSTLSATSQKTIHFLWSLVLAPVNGLPLIDLVV